MTAFRHRSPFLLLPLLLLLPSPGMTYTYSVSGDAIGVDGDIAFVSGGMFFSHASIGLDEDAEVLNISSAGDPRGFFSYLFSVDKNAQGLARTAVRKYYESELSTHRASDDLFQPGDDPAKGTIINRIFAEGISHPHEMDAYDAETLRAGDRIYFGASGRSVEGAELAANVIYTAVIGDDESKGPGTFATAADLGLKAGDAIDALDLVDINKDGRFDSGLDLLVFSLTLDSPSFVSGYQIYTAWNGSLVPLVRSEDLGLRDSDELDALAHAPEPASLALLGGGLIGLLLGRRRLPRAG